MSATLLTALLVLVPASATTPTPTSPAPIHFPVLVNVPAWLNPPRPPTPRPTATDMRTTLRPDTQASLVASLQVPGALVLPAPGEYRGHEAMRVAAGVTLDGRGLVVLRGSGLRVYGAEGVTIRGVTITGAATDAIELVHTRRATIEHVDLSGAADGLIDVIRVGGPGGLIVVRDSILHDDDKCSLVGHFDRDGDEDARVLFERVTFRDCGARTPKVHRALVTLVDCRIIAWRSRAVDVQLGGHVSLTRVRFDEGPDSGPHIRLESGGTFVESGTLFVPFRHRYPAE